MVRLIVSDVDGTLVPDGAGAADPELFDIILKLRDKGIQFAIASGRPWASVEQTFWPVKEKIFYIANNGSYIGCHGRSLFVYSIERALVKRLLAEVKKHPELVPVYAGANGDYVDCEDRELIRWLSEGYKFNLTEVEDLAELEEPCLKLSLYKAQGIEMATRGIYESFKDELQIACAGDMWMDCMAKGVNKGNAVKTIQQSLEITSEETMVFGDQLNDLEMLKQAYYSFAVASAREEVRKAARFQADTVGNGGVLKILRELL